VRAKRRTSIWKFVSLVFFPIRSDLRDTRCIYFICLWAVHRDFNDLGYVYLIVVQVKLFLCTPWRNAGAWIYNFAPS
jgi:hypothetical protein